MVLPGATSVQAFGAPSVKFVRRKLPRLAEDVRDGLEEAGTSEGADTSPPVQRRGRTHTIVPVLEAAGPWSSSQAGDAQEADNRGQDGLDPLWLPFASQTLRTVVWPNPRVAMDLVSMRQRLEAMEDLQALAWLMLTARSDLKPLQIDEVDRRILDLLRRIKPTQFTELKAAEYWIVDSLSEIAPSIMGGWERVRPVTAEGHSVNANKLPGSIGTWVTPHRLASTESARRASHAQRINAISLAGLLIASDRLELLNLVEPLDINPLMPAASIGYDRNDLASSRNGSDIGVVNGYAVALIAHSTN